MFSLRGSAFCSLRRRSGNRSRIFASTLLSFFAYPVYQFGSARGALFVPEMDEAAFPPRRPEGYWLRLARRAIQSLLGLRHKR